MFINVLLAKASHMAKSSLKGDRETGARPEVAMCCGQEHLRGSQEKP